MDPIKDYVRHAIRHVTGVDNDRYDRSISERVFIIDINGDVFNSIESYESRYGNLFGSADALPFGAHRSLLPAAHSRMQAKQAEGCELIGNFTVL